MISEPKHPAAALSVDFFNVVEFHSKSIKLTTSHM